MEPVFFGKAISEWVDIYRVMKFNKESVESFKDLYKWKAPTSPQGCMDLAFVLAEARDTIKDTPVPRWVENILNHRQNTTGEPI
jgi:hypothetical protein